MPCGVAYRETGNPRAYSASRSDTGPHLRLKLDAAAVSVIHRTITARAFMGFVKTRDRECACGVSRGHPVLAALAAFAALAVLATTPHYSFEFLRARESPNVDRVRDCE